jgi:hypothetical protein
MTELFAWLLVALLFALYAFELLIVARLRQRAHRYQLAHERIQGYAHGYTDGANGEIPAVRVADERRSA